MNSVTSIGREMSVQMPHINEVEVVMKVFVGRRRKCGSRVVSFSITDDFVSRTFGCMVQLNGEGGKEILLLFWKKFNAVFVFLSRFR